MTVSKPQSQSQSQAPVSKPEAVSQPVSQEFSLQMDKTLGQLLTDNDESYESLKQNLLRMRQIKISNRAREIADLLNPQRQSEEIMYQAQQIVELESAGAPAIGSTIPALRLMGG